MFPHICPRFSPEKEEFRSLQMENVGPLLTIRSLHIWKEVCLRASVSGELSSELEMEARSPRVAAWPKSRGTAGAFRPAQQPLLFLTRRTT